MAVSAENPFFRLRNICKVYRAATVETLALDDITLSIREGEFVGVMGPSGCGKSTLLNIVAMIDSPSSGHYELGESEVSGASQARLAELRKGNVGFVFQSFHLVNDLSVYKNVELPLLYLNMARARRHRRVREVLELLDLANRAQHRPCQLSGGQQQRVAIARAVVGDPKLIVADEPTGNLDTQHGEEVMDMLTTLNQQGVTIVMATHSPVHARRASRVLHDARRAFGVGREPAVRLEDFRVGLRILLADPVYSPVSLLGLGVGLAVCLLLLGFARYSLSYDAKVPDAGDVYIIKGRNNVEPDARWSDQTPLMLRDAARSAPGVTLAAGFVNWLPLTLRVDGEVRKLRSLTALPGFAALMGLRAIEGDLNEALSRPDSLAITQGGAIRLFGSTDVLDRVLMLTMSSGDRAERTLAARIGAILPDSPANTTIPFEVLTGVNFGLMPPGFRAEALTGAMGWGGNLLVHVKAGASIATITEVLQSAIDQSPLVRNLPPQMKAHLGGRKVLDVKLSPLRAAYFDDEVATNKFSLPVERGNPAVLAGLVAIGILILALAAVNYINLAALRVIRRQREIAMRKVLGAEGRHLAAQFVAESLLVSLLATIAGLLLAWLALPAFSELMNRDLHSLLSLDNVGAALSVGLVLGLLISIYPTWIALGVRPAVMLSGRPDTESFGSKRLRQVLSVLQLAAAMGLASYTMAIYWQTRFAMDASPGFDPSRLLVFDLPIGQNSGTPAARGLIEALGAQPAISSVATAGDAVGRESNPWSTEVRSEAGQGVTLDMKTVSSDFFAVYGIKPVAGRLFDPDNDTDGGDVMVINEIAAHALGFASPERAVDQTVLFWDQAYSGAPRKLVTRRIVGVAPEIRFYSLREAPRAVAYQLTFGATVTVRATGAISDAERAVHSVWSRFNPNTVLELRPAKEIYASNYAVDARLAGLLAVSTVITMLIAAFGTYVLAADAVQRRTGEIALRRLFGASGADIGLLIAIEIGAIVLLSAALAIPPAALAIARYLSSFTAHTSIAFWTLAFALSAAVAVTAFAAARQAWVAVTLEPAVALRGTE